MWSPYIYVRWVLFLVIGIVLEATFKIYDFWGNGLVINWLLGGIFGVYSIFLIFFPKIKNHAKMLFGVLGAIFLVFFGVFRTYHFQEFHQKNHLFHVKDSIIAYTACIDEEVQNRKFSFRTEAEIKEICVLKNTPKGKIKNWQKTKGRAMISFKKETQNPNKILQELKYGDVLLIKGSPFLVIPPENPQEFNYKEYLTFQNIYHHHYVLPNTFSKINYSPQNSFVAYALYLRGLCSKLLNDLVNSPRESAIAVALVLGVKEQMDNEILEAYSGTGLMHVLAVSGMHVGMMLVPFAWFFGFLEKKGLKGKILYASLVLFFLWGYAIVTGFSASVLRAVVMFSLVALGKVFGKKGTMYNILACSAFMLLLYEPFLLWSVGFQLSYLAVLSIIVFQPVIKNWYEAPNKYVFYFWELTSVSLSAQLLTFPLGFYYFHQFPNYFLIANLLIIPISSIVLYLGVICILLGWIPYLGGILGSCLWFGIWLMNYVTLFLEKLPFALTENVYWTSGQTFLMYGFVFCIFLFFIKRKINFFYYATFAFVFFVGIFLFRFFERQSQQFLTIYHTPKQSTLSVVEANKMLVLEHDTASKIIREFATKPALAYWGIREKENVFWKKDVFLSKNFIYKKENSFSFIIFKNEKNPNEKKSKSKNNTIKILVLNEKIPNKDLKKFAKQFENLEVDYVWVQYNAIFDLEKLAQEMEIPKLILDASNSKRRANLLENQAKNLKIPCYNIWEKGFFQVKF